jgi:hypothetical protein
MEFGLLTAFIVTLKLVNTKNYNAVANSQTIQFRTAHIIRCLVTDPNIVLVYSRRYRLATVSHLTHSAKYPHIFDCNSQSSKFCYNRRSFGQSVMVSRPDFCYCQTVAGWLTWDALSDGRTGTSFTVAAGLQRSHSWVQVLRN